MPRSKLGQVGRIETDILSTTSIEDSERCVQRFMPCWQPRFPRAPSSIKAHCKKCDEEFVLPKLPTPGFELFTLRCYDIRPMQADWHRLQSHFIPPHPLFFMTMMLTSSAERKAAHALVCQIPARFVSFGTFEVSISFRRKLTRSSLFLLCMSKIYGINLARVSSQERFIIGRSWCNSGKSAGALDGPPGWFDFQGWDDSGGFLHSRLHDSICFGILHRATNTTLYWSRNGQRAVQHILKSRMKLRNDEVEINDSRGAARAEKYHFISVLSTPML